MKVISPMDDTPASKAGIKSGDMITMWMTSRRIEISSGLSTPSRG
jgi:hypothetical protein